LLWVNSHVVGVAAKVVSMTYGLLAINPVIMTFVKLTVVLTPVLGITLTRLMVADVSIVVQVIITALPGIGLMYLLTTTVIPG
jgi:hypothetical protein